MRHRLMIALYGVLTFSAVPAQTDTFGPASGSAPRTDLVEASQRAVVSGVYTGQWRDGRILIQTVTMITPDMITLQRHAYSSSPVTYRRAQPDLFRDRNGNTLTLIGAERLIWRDGAARNEVTYDRAD